MERSRTDSSLDSWVDVEEDRFQIEKKIFNVHMDGYFPMGSDVVIVSPTAGTSELPEEEYRTLAASFAVRTERVDADGVHRILKKEEKEQMADLAAARLVFIGGKGLKNNANFDKMIALAEKYHAAWGCTRAAALSGWGGYDRVIGISGESLQAEAAVLFGVSGAAPFMAGLENVKNILAVNTDRRAPVFSYADYGMETDAATLVDALLSDDR